MKRKPTECERTFAISTSDRGSISRLYEELKEQRVKETNNPIKNWVGMCTEHSNRSNKISFFKKGSSSLAIRETQIKTTSTVHLTAVRVVKIDKPWTTNASADVEKEEPEFTVGSSADWWRHSASQYAESSKS